MPPALRDRRVVLILGVIGMGKTVLTRFLIRQWQQANPKGKTIILDKNRQFQGGEWPGEFAWNRKAQWDWVRSITNGGRGPPGPRVGKEGALLVCDDGDTYLPEYNSPWNDIWMSPRQLFLDVIVSSHRTQGIPKELINTASDIVIFWTGEVHGLNYLRQLVGDELVDRIPEPVPGDEEGESVKGLALWVKPRARRGEIVDVFKLAGINYKRPDFSGRRAVHGR